MNPLSILFSMAVLAAAVCAAPKQGNAANNNLKPSEWLSSSQLESLPSVEDITMQKLENMPLKEAENMIEKIYHLSQINYNLQPSFVPSPSNVPVYIFKNNGQKVTANLNELVDSVKQLENFGNEEVTIFITGLPQQQSQTVAKANQKLIQAYLQRYNGQQQPINQKNLDNENSNNARTSSEEDYNEEWKNPKSTTGNLIVIDLGSAINNFKRFAMLDAEKTGAMIGNYLVELTNECNVPQEIIHVVAQGVSAHAAGVAARQFTRLTGHKLRRVTALDPSKLMAKNPKTLNGLARGDADFVDAIHTSTNGMGTRMRVGDIDFYPMGPAGELPGAQNVVEASMRATRYYAETVRRGNERNFPAVAANSLKQYQNQNGHGQRAYMGINTDFDQRGDYVLEVNPTSPFGKSAPAQKQSTYHGTHKAWKNTNNQDNQ